MEFNDLLPHERPLSLKLEGEDESYTFTDGDETQENTQRHFKNFYSQYTIPISCDLYNVLKKEKISFKRIRKQGVMRLIRCMLLELTKVYSVTSLETVCTRMSQLD